MPPTPAPLALTGHKVLAKGRQQLVFAHPADRAFVVKVFRQTSGKPNRHMQRELQVFARVTAQEDSDQFVPLAWYQGAVETDLGTGHVFDAIWNRKRTRLAPSLRKFLSRGNLKPGKLKKLNEFVGQLYDSDIPITDLNAGNLVFGNYRGKRRFVMVDGYGEYRKIPFAHWSRRVRKARMDAAFARIGALHDLAWDENTRTFRT